MALFTKYSWTSMVQFLTDFKDFASGNGWTVDLFADYSGYKRVHIHKGSSHFEVYASNASTAYAVGCTSYDSGQGPTSQPNASAAHTWGNLGSGGTGPTGYAFASSGHSIYYRRQWDSAWSWVALATIIDKIGAWTGGCFVSGSTVNQKHMFQTDTFDQQLLLNGSWTANDTYSDGVGAVIGALNNHPMGFAPSPYNAGVLPVPVPVFVRNSSNASLLHPVGFAPGLYRCDPGSVYGHEDQMTIGSTPYLWAYQQNVGYFLMKLEA